MPRYEIRDAPALNQIMNDRGLDCHDVAAHIRTGARFVYHMCYGHPMIITVDQATALADLLHVEFTDMFTVHKEG